MYSPTSGVHLLALTDLEAVQTSSQAFRPLTAHGTHTSGCIGIDASAQLPYTVTASADGTLRVWDFVSRACASSTRLPEIPTAISLHPSGAIAAVGFKDKLSLYNVLFGKL